MRSRFVLVVAAGLLVGAGEPRGDAGAVRFEIPPGSRWAAVRGSLGSKKVDGEVTFRKGNEVKICWEYRPEAGLLNSTAMVLECLETDPATGLPFFPPLRHRKITFRPVGRFLEVEMTGVSSLDGSPKANLRLTLTPAK